MFDLKLKDEEIVMKITARKPISNKEVFFNVVGNLLTGAGGDLADKVNLILTEKYLYLEYKGHASIGFAEETRDVVKLNLNEIAEFNVESNELKELIKIKADNKEFIFIRDDHNNDGLSIAMSKVIQDKKCL
ncbi:MAG: hypothetical protein Q4F66_01270 [Clostridium sp.]|nr:hypothetical protein [Clostridium sp.]